VNKYQLLIKNLKDLISSLLNISVTLFLPTQIQANKSP
jgi:hypothetical protein